MNAAGHWLFALALLLSWANSAYHVTFSDRPVYAMSRRVLEGHVAGARLAVVGVASMGFVLLVAFFVASVWVEAISVSLFLAMAMVRRWEIAQWRSDIVVRLGKYVPTAACFLGWLVAQPILRLWLDWPADRARHV